MKKQKEDCIKSDYFAWKPIQGLGSMFYLEYCCLTENICTLADVTSV